MAITQLIFKKGNFIGEIELDVVITESASATARITKNPVENGADINDHVIIEPMTFSISGVVSNSSSNVLEAAQNIFSTKTKAQEAWEDLLELQINRIPFTLVQGLKSYDNVLITNLSESQDKETSNALYFTATLSEVILVGIDAPPTITYADQDTSDKSAPATNGGLKSIV